MQTTVGKSGWINLGKNAAELIECDTGEKLLTDWKLFRYCNDPLMIQCLETACDQGKAVAHVFIFHILNCVVLIFEFSIRFPHTTFDSISHHATIQGYNEIQN